MVLRQDDHSTEEFRIRINGKWILVTKELLATHPGGSAITTYKNLDATTGNLFPDLINHLSPAGLQCFTLST
jgi:hypothetical protein